MSREHVLPDWLRRIGLDLTPTRHETTQDEKVQREWVAEPFTQRVRDVCEGCNNGWMSRWEHRAKPILAPLILGKRRTLSPEAQKLVAAWGIKTATVFGLMEQPNVILQSDYGELYALREQFRPLDSMTFWIGVRHSSVLFAIVTNTPLAMEAKPNTLPAPDRSNAYLFTLGVGNLVIQGLRIRVTIPKTASFAIELSPALRVFLRPLWPTDQPLAWPPTGRFGDAIIDDGLFRTISQFPTY